MKIDKEYTLKIFFFIYRDVSTCMCHSVYTCIYTYVCVHMCVHLCACEYMSVNMYIYIERERQRYNTEHTCFLIVKNH